MQETQANKLSIVEFETAIDASNWLASKDDNVTIVEWKIVSKKKADVHYFMYKLNK